MLLQARTRLAKPVRFMQAHCGLDSLPAWVTEELWGLWSKVERAHDEDHRWQHPGEFNPDGEGYKTVRVYRADHVRYTDIRGCYTCPCWDTCYPPAPGWDRTTSWLPAKSELAGFLFYPKAADRLPLPLYLSWEMDQCRGPSLSRKWREQHMETEEELVSAWT